MLQKEILQKRKILHIYHQEIMRKRRQKLKNEMNISCFSNSLTQRVRCFQHVVRMELYLCSHGRQKRTKMSSQSLRARMCYFLRDKTLQ